MSEPTAYVIGLRADPRTDVAEWYTLWFEDELGRNTVLTRDDRVLWGLSPERIAAFGEGRGLANREELPTVCDAAAALYAVTSGDDGQEDIVLDTLNLLDDMLVTLGQRAALPDVVVLDRMVKALTEGERLRSVVASAGGAEAVTNPIFGSLGRLFAFSTFIV